MVASWIGCGVGMVVIAVERLIAAAAPETRNPTGCGAVGGRIAATAGFAGYVAFAVELALVQSSTRQN